MKNKKYKLVEVSFSYAEYDILDIELVEGESKKEVIKERFEGIDKVELEEGFGEDWEVWFFIDESGEGICMGEENGIVCIGEDEELFDIIGKEDYSNKEWKKWCKFCKGKK
jgi:hypothetical protein